MEQMQTISTAGYGLYKFILAVLDYCAVFREVSDFTVTSNYDLDQSSTIGFYFSFRLNPKWTG